MMKKIVVLTGAGMSAESGLKTFRDSDGLWENHNVMDVASIEGWERNPELIQNFYNERRKQLFQSKPNKGHTLLADLEKSFDVKIVTQNVDDLHEQAGSTQVMHLHGELKKVRSTKDASLIYELSEDNYEIHMGDLCDKGSQLRPHIVWFGEEVPMIEPATDWVREADILIVIGTSLNVYPAAGLVNYARKAEKLYLIDPQKPDYMPSKVEYICASASEGMEILKDKLNMS